MSREGLFYSAFRISSSRCSHLRNSKPVPQHRGYCTPASRHPCSQALETPRWGEGVREQSQTPGAHRGHQGQNEEGGSRCGPQPQGELRRGFAGGRHAGDLRPGAAEEAPPVLAEAAVGAGNSAQEAQHRAAVGEMCECICHRYTIPLVSLPPQNQVLHNFWKRYLQKSRQAYCENPVYARKRKAAVSHPQRVGPGTLRGGVERRMPAPRG